MTRFEEKMKERMKNKGRPGDRRRYEVEEMAENKRKRHG